MTSLPSIEKDSTSPPVTVDPSLLPVIAHPHADNAGPLDDNIEESWRYNFDRIRHYYQNRPLDILTRILEITIPFTRYYLGVWWDNLWKKDPKTNRQRARQLRDLLTELGPTYIKIGQALSTRPDLVPPVFLEELTRLQDQLPSFPNEIAYRFIEEELGAPPQEVYAELSSQPLAAASLGQVYQGKLKTGEIVAVKVQRPDLTRRITLDIYLLRNIAQWARENIKRVRSDLVGIVDELASRIFEEMNYAQEGRNAERFAELYGHLPEIYVPRIYWEYTGRRVLTMEWIEGKKLTQIQEIQAKGINAAHIVEVGVQCSLRQLLEHGFFHADPHPGNLLAMEDGRLAYLDFGMMSTILPHQRYGLIEAIVHLVNRDFSALAQDYVNLDFLDESTDLTPIIPALSEVFNNALGASVAELNFKKITDEMSAMMYEFPFRVPAYYALIIRSMVTLEGIAIGIDPNFKVLSKAYPYVAKRLLTDPSEELRKSLKDLLFKDNTFRWNRLENLMRNAKDSSDYDFEKVVNQAMEFIFSERGAFLREKIVDEFVNSIDLFGRQTVSNISSTLQTRLGINLPNLLPSSHELPTTNNPNFDHIKNIWEILQQTKGFDSLKVINLLAQLIAKRETQQMGQQIANGLFQKAIARTIRALLIES